MPKAESELKLRKAVLEFAPCPAWTVVTGTSQPIKDSFEQRKCLQIKAMFVRAEEDWGETNRSQPCLFGQHEMQERTLASKGGEVRAWQ
jgi:hypothetical protein